LRDGRLCDRSGAGADTDGSEELAAFHQGTSPISRMEFTFDYSRVRMVPHAQRLIAARPRL
jgi:hypothetical protein